MNAVGVEIQGDGDDIEVTSPFSNAEESSLHAIGSREKTEFCCGSSGASVVVSV